MKILEKENTISFQLHWFAFLTLLQHLYLMAMFYKHLILHVQYKVPYTGSLNQLQTVDSSCKNAVKENALIM